MAQQQNGGNGITGGQVVAGVTVLGTLAGIFAAVASGGGGGARPTRFGRARPPGRKAPRASCSKPCGR